MRIQFLKTVGLLFNFLVAFGANQGVTVSDVYRYIVYCMSLCLARDYVILACGKMNLINFSQWVFKSVGLLACTTRLLFLLLGRLVQAHLRTGTVGVYQNRKLVVIASMPIATNT